MYGVGLFETIKVLAGRPVFFASHLDRLRRGADELGLALAVSDEEMRARSDRCLAANARQDGSLKLVLFQGEGGPGQLILTGSKTYAEPAYERGFRIKTFPDRRPGGLSGLKSLNYLKNLRAKRAATGAGYDEALFVDPGGEILEGATTNIFVVHQKGIFTPPLASGILPGIARATVLKLGTDRPVREHAIGLDLLSEADEVFVTNALLGVMPVAAVDAWRWDVCLNPVTAALRRAYRQRELEAGAA
jgi:branched-subunit amino acid aminotransferase/4-amino-4-deoxychorismate lyase